LIQRLVERRDLTEEETAAAMNAIMSGEGTPAQIGAFVTALRMKGETVAEVTGCARVMREKATPIRSSRRPLVDTCGTGGDYSGTFNISTAAAFVVAGAGAVVAKHGNRAATSQSGSADVLRALGVNVEAEPEVVERCLDEVGIAFLFAAKLHGAMRHAVGPRREIGIRTVFNILGPLTNPAGADCQLLGVFDGAWTEPLAKVLGNLGSIRALVVHGSDGLDEITTTASTRISELHDGTVTTYDFDPRTIGIALATPDALKGGKAEMNAKTLRAILDGTRGPLRDIVLLNAAGGLIAAGLADGFSVGFALAERSVDSGAARAKLDALIRVSNGGSAA
jgi:anthranilate phosphoribosyltransferase